MTFLRSFARPVLLAWLLVFALILAGPASVFAKVEMVNGRDGAEGDPGDSHDYSGGGSDLGADGNQAITGSQPVLRIFDMPILIVVDPRFGTGVMILLPQTEDNITRALYVVRGGAK